LAQWRPGRAIVAFVSAQPAILFGYALWGGIKELAAALLLALLAATVQILLEAHTARAAIPVAVAAAAVVDVLSLGGAAWLVLLAAAPVLAFLLHGRAFALRATGVFAGAAAVCAIPAIVAAVEWLPRSGAFTSESELGNLVGPLKLAQIAGIWPIGDFRHSPHHHDLAPTYVLIA